jgi:hypothetical protein
MPIKYQRVYSDLDENRLLSRRVDEFIGIARTLAMRGALAEGDFRYLAKWLGANKDVMDYPLVRPISDLIRSRVRVPDLLNSIHEELRKLAGDTNGDGMSDGPTTAVYDNPPPPIIFPDKRFCFTGTFNYGDRWECEEAVEERGGECGGIAQRTHYLVIGAKITDAWKHATFGNKISQAKAWQAQGHPIKIVSEAHWVKYLQDFDPDQVADTDSPSGPQTPPTSEHAYPFASKPNEGFGRRRYWLS